MSITLISNVPISIAAILELFYANINCSDINCANIDLVDIDLDNIDCTDVSCSDIHPTNIDRAKQSRRYLLYHCVNYALVLICVSCSR